MHKLWVLARNEVLRTFRDTGAVLMMIAAPLVLILVLLAAFGKGEETPIQDVPLLILNQDHGALGEGVIKALQGESLREVLSPTVVTDEVAARAQVDAGEVAALVIIPPDFSDAVFPLLGAAQRELGLDLRTMTPETVSSLPLAQQEALGALYERLQKSPPRTQITIYASPDWRISTSVIKATVTQVVETLRMQLQGMALAVDHLVRLDLADGKMDAMSADTGWVTDAITASSAVLPIAVEVVTPAGHGFNWVAYMASAQAIFFLTFTATSGGRTLLAEREWGTLPRLLVMPVRPATVLAGKVSGIALAGLLQLLILWGVTTLIGIWWGPPFAVLVALVCLTLAATGVGALIAAWSRSASQAGALGTAVNLVAAAASGTFVPRPAMPAWMRHLSLLTPNAWGIEIFSRLQMGGDLVTLLPLLGGLLLVTLVYYLVALVGFRRQYA